MPRITLRRLVIAGSTAGPVGAVLLASAVIAGLFTALTAVLIALSVTILSALAVIALGIRRLDSKVRGIIHESTMQQAVAARNLADATRSLRTAADDIATHLQDVQTSRGEDRVELLMRLSRTEQHISEIRTDLVQAQDVRAKLEAYTDLRALIAPRAPLPRRGGWAVDVDVLHAVAELVSERRPELIVECGSGSSSVWLGYIVEQSATGRVLSLEHDEHQLQISRNLVRSHHLDGAVEIRHAPLAPWRDEEGSYHWYTPTAVEDLKGIGLLVVGGPPAAMGRHARYPAVPALLPRCTSDVVVVVETNSDDDKTVERWQARWPELGKTFYRLGSAHVLFREPTG